MTSADVLDCNSLLPGSSVVVETKSRNYRIECLGGNAIRISGHPYYCPDPVPAYLEGSFDENGGIEPGLIGPGMRLMYVLGDRPVTTSTVLSVHVEQPLGLGTRSSASLH